MHFVNRLSYSFVMELYDYASKLYVNVIMYYVQLKGYVFVYQPICSMYIFFVFLALVLLLVMELYLIVIHTYKYIIIETSCV